MLPEPARAHDADLSGACRLAKEVCCSLASGKFSLNRGYLPNAAEMRWNSKLHTNHVQASLRPEHTLGGTVGRSQQATMQ
jgi:hypothetical protein